jgi:hypothetical protein
MKEKWFNICPLPFPPSNIQICEDLTELVITWLPLPMLKVNLLAQ